MYIPPPDMQILNIIQNEYKSLIKWIAAIEESSSTYLRGLPRLMQIY